MTRWQGFRLGFTQGYRDAKPWPRWIGRSLFVALAMTIILIAFSALPANAHDWYSGLKNENGHSCCGGDDCAPLVDGDVEEVSGGFFVKSRELFVPYSRTQASADKQYHLCIVPNSIAVDNAPRCFFAPMPGS